MIVRVLHEGQFRLGGAALDTLNEIDGKIVEAVADGNEPEFRRLLKELIQAVHKHGKPVPVDEFVESDVILPAEDSTLEEVQELFSGEGALPG